MLVFEYNIVAGRDTLYTRETDLTFECHGMAPATEPPKGGLSISGDKKEIYVYSDESGVFDKEYNEAFVFGGLIFLKKKDMDDCSRKYLTSKIFKKISTHLLTVLTMCAITHIEQRKRDFR